MTKEEIEILEQAEAIKKRCTERKKKIEYSKRVVAIVLSFCIVVTIFAMFLMWVTKDTGPLAYLIPSVFAETGIVISFYLDKAKKENISKGAKINESELETETNI